ncbi:transcription factor IIA, alpha/beta subunit [Massariosphaeria phaeospora]|uniref:Transcription factor IIA, alpha/beta subunit n=1 Tax=Massariosphaeria phaeospora TaxID=100035 RepID=A0A7C8M5W2_9PLEO|nr:transcription factor IIA, alpha/beta subunit [Massariosphaeria phaeospora]
MSNQVVGSVYQQIIEKVVQVSQNDFEEFGVDQSTLDEMKQGWQEKLSGLKIAFFPWDPQPEPPRQPPTVPSNGGKDAAVSPAISGNQDHLNFPNVAVKTERGYEPAHATYGSGQNGGYSASYGDVAQQRAHALVAQRLHQTQQGMSHPQHHGGQPQMQHPQQRAMPPHGQQRTPQQMQQPQQRPYTSQTDGAEATIEDWNAFKAARAAQAEDVLNGRIAADLFMRAQIDALAANLDSGLMMPIDEMPKGRKHKAATRVLQAQKAEQDLSSIPGPVGFDGEDEVKEEDEDLINSDLDDPEDELNGADGDDDDTMDYMLCTYDKVQRVKNKWKCTLKDGILTTNKKEYLFHKATGEFEW